MECMIFWIFAVKLKHNLFGVKDIEAAESDPKKTVAPHDRREKQKGGYTWTIQQ
jgi:hypothetical protein